MINDTTQQTPLRYGVTGTDTGIGKTVVSCALAVRGRALGLRVAPMKPLESGINDRLISETGLASDAERLKEASGSTLPLSVIRPYVLTEPLAPLVAAARANVSIDVATLDRALEQIEEQADLVLIEGAGGILVPITPTLSYLDLFKRWACPLLIVAGNRLGVLNHVLLTVRAAESAGVPVRAVILTSLTERDATIAEATNFDALVTLLPHYPIVRFPWLDRPDNLDALAAAAEGCGLDMLLTPGQATASPPFLSP